VVVDGVKISPPVSLPGSHGLFQPVATAENWDGGVAGACNQYGFAFSNLAVRSDYKGAWQAFDLSRVLRDPAYQLTLGRSGFTASTKRRLPATRSDRPDASLPLCAHAVQPRRLRLSIRSP
jgi:hypothetical protein